MRFPPFDDRGTLTTIELEALRSLHAAYMTARYEWQSAVAIWDRLYTALDLTELGAPERPPFQHYEEALHKVGNGAHAYERHAALITWRYAASAAVLGITVLERVARAKPPLTASAVEELCQEPTLGRLRDALSVPAADFLPDQERSFRDERKEMTERWADLRDGVDTAIEIVVGIAADDGAAHPRTKEEAAGCLMTEHSPSWTDPVYTGILEPLLVVAEEVPYGISRIIKGR
ncbi:hypothetical protein [Streptomyces stelliscabiei]|uniref:hypothetical protein n=1 Tax=Streptomyces stelliscabiei TaxID=146820 RepID=UPI0029A62AEE|nr:hypothetical protein [Streptomyces stelliscabiei]MDX2557650.1 hypothetical protein [Streptomyces stelliscabiei]MDX2617097.1 hypothetical protein [Streptomyces stelliscabiei]MDX2641471.1 hypothetical protein [Streptomyces stelliscabiei]MDX2666479.1 hypothetical protein [Streptomyces stelliscabiei]MDX2717324.1 hypothetical protein [Streptomyces stelliscabiei]